MRMLITSGAVVTAAASALLFAPSAHATPPGDNGTAKIHDAETGEELLKNEPKVCTFYLDGFKFDGAQKVEWHIDAWANNDLPKGTTVKTGSLTLDGSGHERTEDMNLPDGQYKLFWNFDNEHGSAKHKVFWTDCESEDDKPGDKPSDKPGEKPSDEPSGPAATAPAGTQPTPATSPSVNGASGDLAETGSSAPVGALSATAAALLGAGGYLVMRRRKAQRQH
ncbi:LPXTG cell wall anchor domain-containing protein [Streptomyces sp. NPDC001514]